MPTYTNLNGITGPSQQTLLPQLKTNLAEFFNWGLLGAGFFANISGSVSGAYGGDFAKLRLVSDPNYAAGRVWEGARINWVWETGVENGYTPTIPSGVYVNNVFYPSGTSGAYAHTISYPLGRVIFNSAISTSATVKCFHAEKYVQVGTEDQPWAKEIIFNTYRVDQASGTQVLGQNRIQLPGMIIGTIPNRNSYGMALGGGQYTEQEVYFYIYAENPWDRDKLIDCVNYQREKTLYTFDLQRAASGNAYSLDMNGMRNTSGLIYPDLLSHYGSRKLYFKDVRISEVTNQQPFFKAICRVNLRVEMPEI